MKQKLFLLLILVSLGLTSICQATSTSVNAYFKKNETKIKLNFTKTLYMTIVAHSFEPQFKSYNPVILADRIFFLSYFSEWQKKIDSGQYTHTQEIFDSMLNQPTFVRKFYGLWNLLHQPSGEEIKIRKWEDLHIVQAINRIEKKSIDLEDYTLKLLDFVHSYIIAQKKNYVLALIFYNGFKDSKVTTIAKKAQAIEDTIDFSKLVTEIQDYYDPTLAMGAGVTFNVALHLLKSSKSYQRAQKWINFGSRSKKAAQFLARGGLTTIRFLNKATKSTFQVLKSSNPFRNFNISKSLLASSAIHMGGLLYYDPITKTYQDLRNKIDSLTTTNTTRLEPIEAEKKLVETIRTSLSLLQDMIRFHDTIKELFPIMTDLKFADFTPQFEKKDLNWILSTGDSFLKGSPVKPELFGELILQTEKELNVDNRHPQDDMAMQIIKKQYLNHKRKVDEIFKNSAPEEVIEKVREYMLNEPLYSYDRDNPSLTSLFLDWGGNCVAQTALFISLLYPYKDQLPSGKKLGIFLTKKHIEAVIYDEKDFQLMVHGFIEENKEQVLLRPEYLILLLLRNFPKDYTPSVTINDLIASDTRQIKAPSLIQGKSQSHQKKDKREKSALDTYVLNDFLSTQSYNTINSYFSSENEVTKYQTVGYHPPTKKYYGMDTLYTSRSKDGGKGGDHGQNGPLGKKKRELTEFQLQIRWEPSLLKSDIENLKKQLQNNLPLEERLKGEGKLEALLQKGFHFDLKYIQYEPIIAEVLVRSEQDYLHFSSLKLNPKMTDFEIFHEMVKMQMQRDLQYIQNVQKANSPSSPSIPFEKIIAECQTSTCYEDQPYLKTLIAVDELIERSIDLIWSTYRPISSKVQRDLLAKKQSQSDYDKLVGLSDDLADVDTLIRNEAQNYYDKVLLQKKNFLNFTLSSPEDFLKYFNSLTQKQRRYFFMIMIENLESSQLNNENSNFITKTVEIYHSGIKEYLYRLDQVRILKQPLSFTKIDPPTISKEAAEFLGIILFAQRDPHQKVNFSQTDPTTLSPSEADKKESTHHQWLTLKEEVLLEVTALFGAGHHFWQDSTLEILKSGRFEKFHYTEKEMQILISAGLSNYLMEELPTIEKLNEYLQSH